MNLIGHKNTKSQIATALAAAKVRNRELPHMLFSGHAGCGKTSMAKEIARIAGNDFLMLPPESMKNHKAILNMVELLNHEGYDDKGNRIGDIKPTILFFDEVHNMPLYGQEVIGIIMENFTLDSGKPNQLFWVPYFCLVGATTLAGILSRPFLDRFKFDFVFQPYSYNESLEIIKMHAPKLLSKDTTITEGAIRQIAIRGRGVPRIMVRHLERVRDMAIRFKSKLITAAVVKATYKELGIDEEGFTMLEIKILRSLYNTDIPVGLENLAIITGESQKTIKDSIEPYLIRKELMLRSRGGRIITRIGRDYLEDKGYAGKETGKKTISSDYARK